MKTQAQYTIHSLNDVITSITAPTNPYRGQIWVDTLYSPPKTKVYNGSLWQELNRTDTLRTNISTLTTQQATFQTNLNGLTSDVSAITTRVETVESDTAEAQENILSLQEEVSSLEQTASSISATVSNKADAEYGSSSSSFGWKLKSDGFYLYSNAATVMSVTSSGLTISGNITASSGTIGGFTIASSNLHTGSKTSYSSTTSGVYIGTNGIGLGTGNFYVTSAGTLYARSGTVGGFTLSTNYIYGGTIGADNSVMIGKSYTTSKSIGGSEALTTWGLILGQYFGVTRYGALYCSDAHLTGEITATSGTFDNCTLNDSCTLYGYIYCTGSDEVKFYGTKTTINYETWIGGAGIFSDIYLTPKSGTSHTSYGVIRPYGQIVVPEDYVTFADDGMIFGIMQSNSYKLQSLLCGVSFYFSNDGSSYYSEALFRVGDKQFLDATFSSAGGWISYWGTGTGKNVYMGAWYPDETSSSYISAKITGTTTFTYYGSLYGRWYINDTLYFGEATAGYATTATVNDLKYPFLSGTWYCGILRFGTSSTGYNLKIDPDQVTWFYGTTQVGELESFTTYVDVQGTFKTNGNNWISSSDVKIKNSIEDYSDSYEILFDNLKPRKYKYNAGTSNRVHTGFIVQEVISAIETAGLTTSDFAAVCAFGDANDPATEWGLRYEEIIPLNTWEIQKLKARVAELENKIKILEDSQ